MLPLEVSAEMMSRNVHKEAENTAKAKHATCPGVAVFLLLWRESVDDERSICGLHCKVS